MYHFYVKLDADSHQSRNAWWFNRTEDEAAHTQVPFGGTEHTYALWGNRTHICPLGGHHTYMPFGGTAHTHALWENIPSLVKTPAT